MICCWAFAEPALRAQIPQTIAPARALDAAPVRDAAQDGGGQLWGIPADGPAPRLCRLSPTGHWQSVPAPNGTTGQPLALERTVNGAVVCLWESGDEHLLTAHRGAVSRLVARWTGFLRSPRLFSDHAGNVWVTGLGGDIYRIPAKYGAAGAPEHAYSVADTDYFPGYQKSNEGPDQGREAGLFYHDPLLAAEDSRGGMWFWTDRLAGGGNFAALRGVLRWEDGRMVHYPALPGLPDKPLDWLAPRAPGHLWVSVHNGGVFDLDTETLRALPVLEPLPHLFQSVQKTYSLGSDWYVVTGDPGAHPRALSSALWRQRAGVWQKLIDGLDAQIALRDFVTRPLLPTRAGLWVGSYGAGAWLLPPGGGPPVHLDWHYGYSLSDTTRLFALPAAMGGVVAVMAGQGIWQTVPQTHLESLARRLPSSDILTLTTTRPLVQDALGHIWDLEAPPSAPAVLREWDGTNWKPHPLPPEADGASPSALASDSAGRFWMVPWLGSHQQPPTFVFDPVGERWQFFHGFDSALRAQAGDAPLIRLNGEPPAFSADGRIAYRTQNWHLHFFDGRHWHDWTAPDLGRPGRLDFAFEPPFFNAAGLLCVNVGIALPDTDKNKADTLAWAEASGWHPVPYQPGPFDTDVQNKAAQISPPPLPVTPDSIVKDNQGAFWLIAGKTLYRATASGCRAVYPASRPTPFRDGRRLTGAMTDPKGNTFLGTSLGSSDEYVIVSAGGK